MINPFGGGRDADGGGGFDLSRTIRRLALLGFAVIQAMLVARILLDLGVIPSEGWWAGPIVTYSDLLAAPVQGVGSSLGGLFGSVAGQGLNVAMLVALAAWSVVEALVMRVVRKFDQIQ